MFSRLGIAIVLLGLSACEKNTAASPIPFRLEASHGADLPDYVALRLQNDGDEHLCVPLIETELGNSMTVLPPSADDQFANRPPERLIGGMDVLAGVAVVPPHENQTFLVSIEELKGRSPQGDRNPWKHPRPIVQSPILNA